MLILSIILPLHLFARQTGRNSGYFRPAKGKFFEFFLTIFRSLEILLMCSLQAELQAFFMELFILRQARSFCFPLEFPIFLHDLGKSWVTHGACFLVFSWRSAIHSSIAVNNKRNHAVQWLSISSPKNAQCQVYSAVTNIEKASLLWNKDQSVWWSCAVY